MVAECAAGSLPDVGALCPSLACGIAVLGCASMLVTTARMLSVTKGRVTCERIAFGSCENRARTWTNRAAGLSTSLAPVSALLHALQVSSGVCVFPLLVDSSTTPADRH